MRKRSWISCAAALALSFGAGSQALGQGRLFFTGPYGVGGTYNLYEVRGAGVKNYTPGGRIGRFQVDLAAPVSFSTGDAMAQVPAIDGSGAVTEPISGSNKVAHMGAFSGALAAQEHAFVVQQLGLIGSNVLIGLTDDERYGGGESRTLEATGTGTSPQNGCATGDCAAERLKGFAGQPGSAVNDHIGWQWANGEPYDYQNWNGGEPNDYAGTPSVPGTGEDAVELLTSGLWNDIGDGDGIEDNGTRAYLYEYENRSATPIAIPAANKAPSLSSIPDKTTGTLAPQAGKVQIKEVKASTGQQVSGNNGAVSLLLGGISSSQTVEYYANTLNLNDPSAAGGGQFGGDDTFGLKTIGGLTGDIDDFAVRGHGWIRIPAGQGGQYTFDVNTDDSGELWIYDHPFESVQNGSLTSYGSIAALGDRGADSTLGVVTLQPGDYEFEYVMNERAGGASAELSAAKGAQTTAGGLRFALIGSGTPASTYDGGTTPTINGNFAIREAIALPATLPTPTHPIGNLTDAKKILLSAESLANGGPADPSVDPESDDDFFTGTATSVNHADPNVAGGGQFGGNQAFLNDGGLGFDDDDFVFNAKTTVHVATAGQYTFAFDSDDGAQVIIDGASFTSQFGPGVVTDGGTALTADILTGSSLSGASTFLTAGDHQLEFWMWERGGGAFAELFVAPGIAPGFSTEQFSLLTTTSTTVGPINKGAALEFGDGTFTGGQLGDTNGDGKVDIVDLNNVRNNFGGNAGGDTDGDGDVDITDLNNVRNNFGAGGAAPNAVPEPSSLVLAGLGLVGLLAARRFRK